MALLAASNSGMAVSSVILLIVKRSVNQAMRSVVAALAGAASPLVGAGAAAGTQAANVVVAATAPLKRKKVRRLSAFDDKVCNCMASFVCMEPPLATIDVRL